MSELREMIKNAGFTISGFAKEIGLSEKSFRRRLKGEVAFSILDIKNMAKVFGISEKEMVYVLYDLETVVVERKVLKRKK